MNQYADEVIVRPNKGFDITAYKLGIFNEKYLELVKYDEVIILIIHFWTIISFFRDV